MEETEVIIVGAGPSGLVLALALSKFKVKTVIIEREREITQDPRGVFLTHDANRILWDLGIENSAITWGHENPHVNFHTSRLDNKPFFQADSIGDFAQQAVPNGVLQMQPRLEDALRSKVLASPFCDLRCGCEVFDHETSTDSVIAIYKNSSGTTRKIRGNWLVGADGKRGIVRKKFLEPSAGVRQIDSPILQYNGTWIAANLKITLPTRVTHPRLPLWDLKYTAEDVYDLFWPQGWHFCSPPGKATACGRFGPYKERVWRHEFEQDNWTDTMNAESLLWTQLDIQLSRSHDAKHDSLPCGNVTFPRDCIKITRCRAFRFTHKVVNKWFHDRTILIGDAAHVYPPFGGQGIASGLRDAHQLSWRLFLLLRLSHVDRALRDETLGFWARERADCVRKAAQATKINGALCNQGDSWRFWLYRQLMWLNNYITRGPKLPHPLLQAELRGFRKVENGFFSERAEGGGRVAQIYVRSQCGTPSLSDRILGGTSVLTLIVLGDDIEQSLTTAKTAIQQTRVPDVLLSGDSVRGVCSSETGSRDGQVVFALSQQILLEAEIPKGYTSSSYFERFQAGAKYVLVRPDFYIYGQASTTDELIWLLRDAKRRLSLPDQDARRIAGSM